MSRRAVSAAALLAPAFFCACHYPDGVDPRAEMPRHAPDAPRSGRRRRRRGAWMLVKYWTAVRIREGSATAEEPVCLRTGRRERRPVMLSPGRDAEEAGIRVAFPPSVHEPAAGVHRSILIREGESGFLALARGEPVGRFSLGGESFGGGDDAVVRGFEISPRLLQDGSIAATLVPVFVGLDPADAAPGAGRRPAFAARLSSPKSKATSGQALRSFSEGGRPELRVDDLALVINLDQGETVIVSSSPEAEDEVVRALFGPGPGEDDSDGEARPLALWFRVKVVR